MAIDEQREPVSAGEFFGELRIPPPPGQVTAAFVLARTSDGEWCARSVGDYSRTEFLGALTAYTYALKQDEAEGWFDEDQDDE